MRLHPADRLPLAQLTAACDGYTLTMSTMSCFSVWHFGAWVQFATHLVLLKHTLLTLCKGLAPNVC